MGGVAVVKACPKTGGINAGVGIALKEGIRLLSNRALFGKALFSIFSGRVYK